MDRINEGELYKVITVEEKSFHVYYGYYSDTEREMWEPVPIFPNFEKEPVFTNEGKPYTRADQDACEHYLPKPDVSGEDWCNDCKHFSLGEDVIGVCRCDKRKMNTRQNE